MPVTKPCWKWGVVWRYSWASLDREPKWMPTGGHRPAVCAENLCRSGQRALFQPSQKVAHLAEHGPTRRSGNYHPGREKLSHATRACCDGAQNHRYRDRHALHRKWLCTSFGRFQAGSIATGILTPSSSILASSPHWPINSFADVTSVMVNEFFSE